MKRLSVRLKTEIVMGMILMLLSGCAAMIEKAATENYKREIERRTWNFIRQTGDGEYYIFAYKVDMTSDLGKKIRILVPMIDNLLNAKWIEGELHVRCDKFSRFSSLMIRDVDGKLLYWEKNDEWGRWYWTSVIEGLCRDEGICGR